MVKLRTKTFCHKNQTDLENFLLGCFRQFNHPAISAREISNFDAKTFAILFSMVLSLKL